MRILRVRAIARKEFIQVWRDPFSLAMAFLMPVILLIIFGYAITLDVENLSTIVYDQDRSSLSRDLISRFRESGYFSIVEAVERPEDIDLRLDGGKARVSIWIPEDFSRKVRMGRPVQLQVIVDGSDSNTATIAQGYVAAIGERFGQSLAGDRGRVSIDARIRVWYNPELKSKNFIVPGLIAVIMAVVVALLSSLTIAREWERGTMEQLISTPVKTPELILGKLIPYFLIGLVDTAVSVAMTVWVFQVPLRGSVLLLFGLSGVFLFGGLCQGILISTIAGTQILASQMAMLSTFLPALLLSGFMFAIANMPEPLQIITYVLPARYFVSVVKGIFLKGSGLGMLTLEAVFLILFGVVLFAAANRKFKKRIP